jgi:hypothetical protein
LVSNNSKSKRICGKIPKSKDFEQIGGGTLLKNYYNSSPSLLITTIFPENQLLPWKFTACPHNFWSNIENQRKFMNWAAEQLNVKKPSDWYSKSVKVRKFVSRG